MITYYYMNNGVLEFGYTTASILKDIMAHRQIVMVIYE
jgi:hypothetical protein